MSHSKLKIARLFTAVLFALVAALLVMTACAPDDNGDGGDASGEVAITWNLTEATHLEVKADNYDTLPTKVAKGTTIAFTVNGKDGYTVDAVFRGNTRMTVTNGKYSYRVNADTTFRFTERKDVDTVNVTVNSGVTFYAGDVVEKNDLTVEVVYKTSATDKEVIPFGNYSVIYPNGENFKLGDTSFQVRYLGKDYDGATIPAVLAKVTINPVAGVLGDEFVNGLETRSGDSGDLKDFHYDTETGIVTFAYAALTSKITLPTSMDTREGLPISNPTFKGWANVNGDEVLGITEITSANQISLNIQAQYDAKIVTFKSVDLKSDNGVPTLEVTFTKPQASGAYLFLYEGNQKFAVKGDLIPIPETGDTATADLDLTKLAAATNADGTHFWGAWMDIRVAVEINGVVFSDTVVMGDDVDVEMGKMVHDDENCYRFIHYVRDGNLELKVYFNRYAYDYDVKVKDGATPTLEVSGHINTKLDEEFTYEGADVAIALGSYSVAGKVAKDGSFTATLDLTTVSAGTNVTAGNITVTSGGKTLNTNVYEKGALTKTTLDLIGCGTIFEDSDPTASGNRNYFTSIVANGLKYTVGTDWNEFFFTVVPNEMPELTVIGDIALKVDNVADPTIVYYVVTVQSSSSKEDLQKIYFGNHDPANNTHDVYTCAKVTDVAEGVYRLWYDITAYPNEQLWPNLYWTTGPEDNLAFTKILEIKDADHSVNGLFAVVNGRKYTIGCASDSPYWDGPCVVPSAATEADVNDANKVDPDKWDDVEIPEPAPTLPEDATFTTTDVTIEKANTVVYYVIHGTYSDCTPEELKAYLEKAYYFDFEQAGGHYTRYPDLARTAEAADGKFTLKIDVTSMPQGKYTSHFGGTGTNLTLADESINGRKVTLGDNDYELVNVPSATDDVNSCYGTVGLWVKATGTVATSFTVSDVTLEADNESNATKVWYVITVTVGGYTQEDLKTAVLYNGDTTVSLDVAKSTITVDGECKLYFDVTSVAASEGGEWLWPHIKINDQPWNGSNGDINFGTAVAKTYTINGVQYSIQISSNMPVLITKNV